ncbi:hypothetical protein WCLP8_2190002 [uncultured Gammaproteobacteria bacterium]
MVAELIIAPNPRSNELLNQTKPFSLPLTRKIGGATLCERELNGSVWLVESAALDPRGWRWR